jgi:hypothetical protein
MTRHSAHTSHSTTAPARAPERPLRQSATARATATDGRGGGGARSQRLPPGERAGGPGTRGNPDALSLLRVGCAQHPRTAIPRRNPRRAELGSPAAAVAAGLAFGNDGADQTGDHAARGISADETPQPRHDRYVVVHNPGGRGRRRFLIGVTDGGRVLTLVIEQTVDPTTGLIVTGWTQPHPVCRGYVPEREVIAVLRTRQDAETPASAEVPAESRRPDSNRGPLHYE